MSHTHTYVSCMSQLLIHSYAWRSIKLDHLHLTWNNYLCCASGVIGLGTCEYKCHVQSLDWLFVIWGHMISVIYSYVFSGPPTTFISPAILSVEENLTNVFSALPFLHSQTQIPTLVESQWVKILCPLLDMADSALHSMLQIFLQVSQVHSLAKTSELGMEILFFRLDPCSWSCIPVRIH